jgi:hypothetical protein
MGKKIAAFLGVLASLAGILSLLLALHILHAISPPSTPTGSSYTCIQGYVWREAVPMNRMSEEVSISVTSGHVSGQNRDSAS